jgi:hypothetical protein
VRYALVRIPEDATTQTTGENLMNKLLTTLIAVAFAGTSLPVFAQAPAAPAKAPAPAAAPVPAAAPAPAAAKADAPKAKSKKKASSKKTKKSTKSKK